ncbi:hypothetical protein ACIA48_24915 [Mycobacterium sp. NPDC051804]|uniref:hypothetical protein n=1 Tax=Mycobacterium sp. NPDC051804 TaxID=3364295 RepID=UPI00379C9886
MNDDAAGSVLAGALVDLFELLAADAHQLGLTDFVQNKRAFFAPGLAATTLFLRFYVEQLAGLQVTCLSRFRV